MTFLTIKNMHSAEESDPAIAETVTFFRSLGAEIHEMEPAVYYCCFHMPFWNVNKVFVERACAYETLVEKLAAFGHPYSWIIAEDAYDEVAQAFLSAQGFMQTATLTSMVCDVAKLQAVHAPDCLEYPLQAIEPMIDFLQDCFSFPAACAEQFLEKIQALKDTSLFYLFYGTYNEKIVSSGWLFVGGEQAGIFYIGTKKEARNQGMAHAMVQTLLHRAKQLGVRRVVLTALGSARKLYEKSGFCALKEYRTFGPTVLQHYSKTAFFAF